MTPSKHLAGLAAVAAGLFTVACTEQPLTSQRPAALAAADAPEQVTLLHGTAGGRVLLLGLPGAAPTAESEQQPGYRLRMARQGGPPRPLLAGDPLVLDAAISASGELVAVVRMDRRLQLVRVADAPASGRTLAARAAPGLAFAPHGRALAHVCADQEPETDICLTHLPGGETRRLSTAAGPDNRPGFSADGRRVFYVGSVGGVASLLVADLGRGHSAPLAATPPGAPMPVGPRGPLDPGEGGSLVFDTGQAVVALTGGHVATLAPAGTLVLPGRGKARVALVRWSGGRAVVRQVRP